MSEVKPEFTVNVLSDDGLGFDTELHRFFDDLLVDLDELGGSGDEDICTEMKEEMLFSGECHAELSKHERSREYEKRQDELLHWLAEEMARFEEADSPGEAEVATGVVVQHDGACLEAGSVLKDA